MRIYSNIFLNIFHLFFLGLTQKTPISRNSAKLLENERNIRISDPKIKSQIQNIRSQIQNSEKYNQK